MKKIVKKGKPIRLDVKKSLFCMAEKPTTFNGEDNPILLFDEETADKIIKSVAGNVSFVGKAIKEDTGESVLVSINADFDIKQEDI